MKTLLLVGLGGGTGSILRYLTSAFVSRYLPATFPWATFTVNIAGCLLIGIIIGMLERQQVLNNDLKLLLITGFCGGYTTFSAFATENFNLIQNGNSLVAMLYIAASIAAGIIAVWGGLALIKTF